MIFCFLKRLTCSKRPKDKTKNEQKSKKAVTSGKMKKILIALLCITTFFTGLAVTRGKDSIVVCSCLEQFRNDDMAEQLQEYKW